jgi:hypothetical protein
MTDDAKTPHPVRKVFDCRAPILSGRNRRGEPKPESSKSAAKPRVITERPSLPTLWIDTAIAVNIAAGRDPRCLTLKDLVHKAVRARTLLSPNADQHEEFEGRRLDQAAYHVLEDLSLAIHLRHRGGIADNLIAAAMKAHVLGSDTIETTLDTYFHGDPVEELRSLEGERFYTSVPPYRIPEVRQRREDAKRGGQAECEALRQRLVAQGQTYEKQLEIELRRGYAEFVIEALRNYFEKSQSGEFDFWGTMTAMGPLKHLRMWNDFGGQP